MSEQMLGMLVFHCFDETMYNEYGEATYSGGGLKEKPDPISIDQFANYFVERLAFIDKALDEIKQAHPAAEHYLRNLSDQHYGMSCSDGVFKDKEMIGVGIGEILYVWKKMKIVSEINGGWILDFKRMGELGGYEKCIIKEIEM
jgi:hypothetical protein